MYDFYSMIDYAISEAIRDIVYVSIFPRVSKFVKRLKKGIVLYTKPNKNIYQFQYKMINFDRRIASLRIFTHTKK